MTEPGDFGYKEVPQLVDVHGRYHLLFSVQRAIHSSRWHRRTGREPLTGVHDRAADDPLGPFPVATDRTLVGDETGSLYAAKLVQDPHGEWVMLAARMVVPDGSFVGALSDPIPVTVSETGLLSASQP